ncbi:MAG: SDR family NAD(P)-dependent oxidoreductase [Candidatus Velthaea sp.]
MDFLQLPDRVAIVTGGARGIGRAIAERLHAAGARIVIADADEAAAIAMAQRLGDGAERAIAVRTDVTDPTSVEAMIGATLDAYVRIDILINNAGITGRTVPLWELTFADWQRVLSVDLDGVFHCCKAVIDHMRERKSGAIVNIASIAGKEGNPTLIPYSVAKAGVIALTKALAKETATAGIRVNAVAPAVIETELLQQVEPDTVKYMLSKIPMGRPGTVEEIAAVVHFLASDDAGFVTGQTYDASGGRATY